MHKVRKRSDMHAVVVDITSVWAIEECMMCRAQTSTLVSHAVAQWQMAASAVIARIDNRHYIDHQRPLVTRAAAYSDKHRCNTQMNSATCNRPREGKNASVTACTRTARSLYRCMQSDNVGQVCDWAQLSMLLIKKKRYAVTRSYILKSQARHVDFHWSVTLQLPQHMQTASCGAVHMRRENSHHTALPDKAVAAHIELLSTFAHHMHTCSCIMWWSAHAQ